MRTFVPFLLGLFLIAAVLHVDFFFTIAYLFFAVYLLARVWTRHNIAHLRFERHCPERAHFGDRLPVLVRVHNTGRLVVPWLQLHETLPVELAVPPQPRAVLSLGPGERREVTYTLDCRRRGYYAVGPMDARTGDLLGIADSGPLVCPPGYLTVYPQIVPLERLGLPTRSPHVALPAQSPLFEDPARITGVRDYRRGDSPRRIHWTATARAGRLLVKQYQPAIARDTLVCLDLDESSYSPRQRYDASELAIVVAASLASHIVVRERLPAGLLTEAWDPWAGARARLWLPPRRERAHLMDVLAALARVQLAPAAPLPEMLRHARVKLGWGATVVAVTPRAGAELFEELAGLRHAGFAVAAILVQPDRPSAEWRRHAEVLGIRVHQVWHARDLEALW